MAGRQAFNTKDCATKPNSVGQPKTNYREQLESRPNSSLVSTPATTTLMPLKAPKKKLSHEEYAVGWICALPKEAVPAILTLDEEHERLYGESNDQNSYFFGRMGEHNVVIATLPKGTYGETSAATVATDMVRSFKSLRFCLMVGIGAGIPSAEHDIQLGDVVVSTPQNQLGGVVQYDFGRENADGTFTQRSQLNRPPRALLTALANFEVNDDIGRSRIPFLIEDIQRESIKMRKIGNRFKHPGAGQDNLFQPDYECQSKEDTCESCDKGKTYPRTNYPRDFADPVVHYGIIASGNRLVRSATLRDRLGKEYNALCIEMEAAGLMNNFPSLVIRGICDYADSHKNNLWQDYAALAATACARELLDFVSPDHVRAERKVIDVLQNVYVKVDGMEKTIKSHQKEQRDRELLDFLCPSNFSSRHDAISSNRVKGTGKWILENPHFRDWRLGEANTRVICCFGEPGAGKTYITSLVIDTLREDLENSKPNKGMAYLYCDYRDRGQKTGKLVAAIVKQLLEPLDVIPEKIVEIYSQHRKAGKQILLSEAMQMLHLACEVFDRIYVCVDALDELEDDERKQLLKSLRDIPPSVHLFTTGRNHVKSTARIYLEQSRDIYIGADENDIRNLIKERVKNYKHDPYLMDETLEHEITEKIVNWSTGNFLLSARQIEFVLDADTKFRRRSNLEKLPASISEAFGTTIERIQQQSENSRTRGRQILTWVYLTGRLLSVEELLHALATEPGHDDLRRDNFLNRETFLDNCLGLVIMDEQTSTVRLVHKSLQDYLDTRSDLFDSRYDTLAETCLTYLMFQSVITHSKAVANKVEAPKDALHDLALVEYAACHWGHHLRKSGQKEKLIVELAKKYLTMSPQERYWSQWYLCKSIVDQYDQPAEESFVMSFSELHITAHFGTHLVLLDLLKTAIKLDSKDSKYGRSPLSWAASNGYDAVVKPLLEKNANPEFKDNYSRTPLSYAAQNGHEIVVELLLKKKASPDSQDKDGLTPLSYGASNGHEAVVALLLEKEVKLETQDDRGRTPLWHAAANGHKVIVKQLLEKGANINAKDDFLVTALHWTAVRGDWSIMALLLENAANIEVEDVAGGTPLAWAIELGFDKGINGLLANGAKVEYWYTPIAGGSEYIRKGINKWAFARVLEMSGFTREFGKYTPLMRAVQKRDAATVTLLLEKGSDPHTKNSSGRTPLLEAKATGDNTIIKLLDSYRGLSSH